MGQFCPQGLAWTQSFGSRCIDLFFSAKAFTFYFFFWPTKKSHKVRFVVWLKQWPLHVSEIPVTEWVGFLLEFQWTKNSLESVWFKALSHARCSPLIWCQLYVSVSCELRVWCFSWAFFWQQSECSLNRFQHGTGVNRCPRINGQQHLAYDLPFSAAWQVALFALFVQYFLLYAFTEENLLRPGRLFFFISSESDKWAKKHLCQTTNQLLSASAVLTKGAMFADSIYTFLRQNGMLWDKSNCAVLLTNNNGCGDVALIWEKKNHIFPSSW